MAKRRGFPVAEGLTLTLIIFLARKHAPQQRDGHAYGRCGSYFFGPGLEVTWGHSMQQTPLFLCSRKISYCLCLIKETVMEKVVGTAPEIIIWSVFDHYVAESPSDEWVTHSCQKAGKPPRGRHGLAEMYILPSRR